MEKFVEELIELMKKHNIKEITPLSTKAKINIDEGMNYFYIDCCDRNKLKKLDTATNMVEDKFIGFTSYF